MDGLTHHLVAHVVLWEALLLMKRFSIHFSKSLKLVIFGEPVPPSVVLVEDLGRLFGGNIPFSIGISFCSLVSSKSDDSTLLLLVGALGLLGCLPWLSPLIETWATSLMASS